MFGRDPNFKSLKGLEERKLIAGSHKIFVFLARRKSNLCECTRTYIGKILAFLRNHRRNINTEEKAQVVAAVSGTEFIHFLATPAILH